jgi:hypothetical protein
MKEDQAVGSTNQQYQQSINQAIRSALQRCTQTTAEHLTRATAALREAAGDACLLTAALLACRPARSSSALVLYCIDMVRPRLVRALETQKTKMHELAVYGYPSKHSGAQLVLDG